jgi:hypothetical protein
MSESIISFEDYIAPWANYGLSGLVIGALFITIWAIGKQGLLHILDMHREERQEWREMMKNLVEKNDEAINKLADAVNSMNNRTRIGDKHD